MDFKQQKMLIQIQQEFSKLQEELENIHIEAEIDSLVLTIDGNGTVLKAEFEQTSIIGDKNKLETVILQTFNKGMKKAKEIAQEKMQNLLSKTSLNLPKKKRKK